MADQIAIPGPGMTNTQPPLPWLPAALASGGAGAIAGLGGALTALGNAGQSQPIINTGEDIANFGAREAAATARPDIEGSGWFSNGLGGFLTKAGYTAAQQAPNLLGYAIAGRLGGPAGMAAYGAAQSAGETERAAETSPQGATPETSQRALEFGVPLGILSAALPSNLMRTAGSAVPQAITDAVLSRAPGWTRPILNEVGGNAVLGALGSGGQEAANQYVNPSQNPTGDVLSSAASGAVGGGVLGGLFGIGRGILDNFRPQEQAPVAPVGAEPLALPAPPPRLLTGPQGGISEADWRYAPGQFLNGPNERPMDFNGPGLPPPETPPGAPAPRYVNLQGEPAAPGDDIVSQVYQQQAEKLGTPHVPAGDFHQALTDEVQSRLGEEGTKLTTTQAEQFASHLMGDAVMDPEHPLQATNSANQLRPVDADDATHVSMNTVEDQAYNARAARPAVTPDSSNDDLQSAIDTALGFSQPQGGALTTTEQPREPGTAVAPAPQYNPRVPPALTDQTWRTSVGPAGEGQFAPPVERDPVAKAYSDVADEQKNVTISREDLAQQLTDNDPDLSTKGAMQAIRTAVADPNHPLQAMKGGGVAMTAPEPPSRGEQVQAALDAARAQEAGPALPADVRFNYPGMEPPGQLPAPQPGDPHYEVRKAVADLTSNGTPATFQDVREAVATQMKGRSESVSPADRARATNAIKAAVSSNVVEGHSAPETGVTKGPAIVDNKPITHLTQAGAPYAVQERSPAGVDVRQPPGNGQGIRGGDAGGDEAPPASVDQTQASARPVPARAGEGGNPPAPQAPVAQEGSIAGTGDLLREQMNETKMNSDKAAAVAETLVRPQQDSARLTATAVRPEDEALDTAHVLTGEGTVGSDLITPANANPAAVARDYNNISDQMSDRVQHALEEWAAQAADNGDDPRATSRDLLSAVKLINAANLDRDKSPLWGRSSSTAEDVRRIQKLTLDAKRSSFFKSVSDFARQFFADNSGSATVNFATMGAKEAAERFGKAYADERLKRQGQYERTTANTAKQFGKVMDGVQNLGRVFDKTPPDLLSRGQGAKQFFRRLGANFMDFQAMERAFSQLPQIKNVNDLIQQARAMRGQLSERAVHSIENAARYFGSGAGRQYGERVIEAMNRMTQLKLDPFKPWEAHTWHSNLATESPREYADLRQMHNQLRGLVQALGATPNGEGLQHLRNMIQLGRTANQALVASAVHTFGQLLAPELFNDQHPAEKFQFNDAAKQNASNEYNFWKGQADAMLTRVSEFAAQKEQAAVASGNYTSEAAARRAVRSANQDLYELRDMYSSIQGRGEQAPYFHLGRDGDQYVSFKLARGKNGDGSLGPIDAAKTAAATRYLAERGFDLHLTHLGNQDSVAVRLNSESAMSQLVGHLKNLQAKGFISTADVPHFGQVGETLPNEMPRYMRSLLDKMERSDIFRPNGDVGQAEMDRAKAQLMTNLRHAVWASLPQTSIDPLMTNRRGVQGFNWDAFKNMANYSQRVSHSISHFATMNQRFDQLAGARAQIEQMRESGHGDLASRLQDAFNSLVTRTSLAEKLPDRDALDAIIKRSMGFVHTSMIGVSPGYVALQLSQIPTKLFPELFKHNSATASFNAITKNTALGFKIMGLMAKNGVREGITPELLQKAGLNPNSPKGQAFMYAVNAGHITDASFAVYLDQLSRNGIPGKFGQTMAFANHTAAWAETLPRVIGALSAADLHAQAKPSSLIKQLSPGEYASQVVRSSMYDWGNETMIPAMRWLGKASPLVGQFEQYQWKSLGQLYNAIHDSIGGAAPEMRDEARRWLLGHAAATMVFGGVMGLPAAAFMANAITKTSGIFNNGEGFDVEHEFQQYMGSIMGDKMAEALTHGVTRAGGYGVDTAKYSDAEMVPFTQLLGDRRKFEDAFPDWMSNSSGATLNTASNLVLGARDILNGRPVQGALRFVPTALRNPLNAFRMGQVGWQNSQGENIGLDPRASDILSTALGLKPAQLADYQDRNKSAQGAIDDIKFRGQQIRQNLARSLEQGDAAGQQKWTQEAQQFDTDPEHFGNQILPGFSAYYSSRQAAQAYARNAGVPLGVSPRSIALRQMYGLDQQ